MVEQQPGLNGDVEEGPHKCPPLILLVGGSFICPVVSFLLRHLRIHPGCSLLPGVCSPLLPASTWCLTTVCDPNSRQCDILLWPRQAPGMHVHHSAQVYMQAKHLYTEEKEKKKGKRQSPQTCHILTASH